MQDYWLGSTPMVLADLDDFGSADLRHRLLRGGLPPFFLAEPLPERDFRQDACQPGERETIRYLGRGCG
ncbi:MAG: hypothetical protein A2X52_15110 [Candidatus Rokubacteria bacterium GWC2_70_16]|nr:MAG: hypothetical protein A2X52_15110 [Candidatus Rokubacteria bacterium GWC2_70_16]OGL21291.1 MAG: hypothetical protein A3K12_10630 [Candidatus Rokubacteria bacterium RIFCSPLOWO2_12_FULL_71_19]